MEKRNYGIDLLRVLVMLMVINLHLLVYGGPSELAAPLSGSYNVLWLLAIAADCAVNCFGIISGYVSYGKPFKPAKLLRLHLTVVLYGVVITGAVHFLKPEAVTNFDLLRAIAPICTQSHWFYSVYAVMFLFMPLLSRLVSRCSKEVCKRILLTAVVLFSILPTATGLDFFAIHRGYGLPWMGLLFFTGMYLRKYQTVLYRKKAGLLILYVGCVAITWGLKLGLELWSLVTQGAPWTPPC